ncbi:MAG: hypothetical protein Q8N60_02720, partial [Candidatus Diapherotrites archaeon]|nr:hypothetical protein [Candidatus Diapherotrites archaeon]
MKKPWFFLALLFFVILLAGGAGAANGNFRGGNGTAAEPWQIEDCLDLQAMNRDLGAIYVLVAPINCSGTATWNEDPVNPGTYFGFEPIGGQFDPFAGAFDGKGFEITGLTINRVEVPFPGNGIIGLFGNIENADLMRVKLIDVDISGNSFVGALAGASTLSTILCSSSTGKVKGT